MSLLRSEAFQSGPRRTPLLIAAVALLVLVPALAFLAAWKTHAGVLYGDWYWGYLALVGLARWLAAFGLWRLRRAGAYLAWLILAADLGFGAFLGELGWFGAILSGGTALLIALDFGELS